MNENILKEKHKGNSNYTMHTHMHPSGSREKSGLLM